MIFATIYARLHLHAVLRACLEAPVHHDIWDYCQSISKVEAYGVQNLRVQCGQQEMGRPDVIEPQATEASEYKGFSFWCLLDD